MRLPTIQHSTAQISNQVAIVAWLIFVIWTGLVTSHHEIWRDEAQDWLLVRDSASVSALLAQLRYEGHPPLWYGLIATLQALGLPIMAKNALGWIIGCLTSATLIWGFGRKSLGVLLSFGYFFVYEYSAFGRPYGLTALFIFGAATLAIRNRVALSSVLTGLAALTTAYGAILAPLSFIYFNWAHRKSTRGWLSGLVVLACLMIAAYFTRSIPDRYPHEAYLTLGLARGLSTYFASAYGLLYWPDGVLTAAYSWMVPESSMDYMTIILVIPAVTLLAAWSRGIAAGLFFTACFLVLAGFNYIFNPGMPRHWGFYWVALLLAFLKPIRDVETAPEFKLHTVFLYLLAVASVIPGIAAAMQDLQRPFSLSDRAAVALRATLKPTDKVYVSKDAMASAAIALADIKQVHFAEGDRPGSFVHWDLARQSLRATPRPEHTVLLLTERPAPEHPGFIEIASFNEASATGERFYIYRRAP